MASSDHDSGRVVEEDRLRGAVLHYPAIVGSVSWSIGESSTGGGEGATKKYEEDNLLLDAARGTSTRGQAKQQQQEESAGRRQASTHEWYCYLRPVSLEQVVGFPGGNYNTNTIASKKIKSNKKKNEIPTTTTPPALEGGFYNLISHVIFTLDNSFDAEERTILLRKPPFEVRKTGWGQVYVDIEVHFRYNVETPVRFQHLVQLFADTEVVEGEEGVAGTDDKVVEIKSGDSGSSIPRSIVTFPPKGGSAPPKKGGASLPKKGGTAPLKTAFPPKGGKKPEVASEVREQKEAVLKPIVVSEMNDQMIFSHPGRRLYGFLSQNLVPTDAPKGKATEVQRAAAAEAGHWPPLSPEPWAALQRQNKIFRKIHQARADSRLNSTLPLEGEGEEREREADDEGLEELYVGTEHRTICAIKLLLDPLQETNTNSLQTLKSNVEAQANSIDDVQAVLDGLEYLISSRQKRFRDEEEEDE